MSEHARKKIAPIVITVLLVIFYAFYFCVIISVIPDMIIKVVIGIIPLCLGGATLSMFYQRMKEIDGGEEDDLGKY